MRVSGIACLLVFLTAMLPFCAKSQTADSSVSIQFLIETKQWNKALPVLKKAWDAAPGNPEVYHDYLTVLLASKEYKTARLIVEGQQRFSNNPTLLIDLGRVLESSGKPGKAVEQFDAAVQAVNGDEIRTEQLAKAFITAGHKDYAIKVYERHQSILPNPYLFSTQLARLYAGEGDLNKAMEAILRASPSPFISPDDTKALLLELLGDDPANLKIAQKALIRSINLQPENNYYPDLLVWLYTRKGDWEGALIQVEAIDQRTKGNGQNLLEFARLAEREGQYETAVKCLQSIIDKGSDQPYYGQARAMKLSFDLKRLEQNPNFTKEDVAILLKDYQDFIAKYPQFNASDIVTDYAKLVALYEHDPEKAIEVLEQAITQPSASKEFIGNAKLQMGDYLVLEGKIWDASLIYSQVDKAFREDMLGEEARFRNAKLAYYRGDFPWAQAQLSVLKASTSELIANDALYLSVLITENMPDSNVAALLLFSRADLLLFQNKNAEALKVLDSITILYPKHPLQDDVLMLRASLAQKEHDYTKALSYLGKIFTEYGKDVLGDDAVFKTAEIYERALKKPEEAIKFYEQLIIDYPGSTYAQIARNRLKLLTGATPQT